VAAQLPGHLGVELLSTARAAFARAFALTAAISAAVALAMAVFAVILLGRPQAGAEPQRPMELDLARPDNTGS